jgi:hypothetical protein
MLQMCVTVNDLEYVRRSLSVLGAELHVEAVLEAVEAATGDAGKQQWRQALYAMLEGAINQLEARALQVINRVAAKVSHYHKADNGSNTGYPARSEVFTAVKDIDAVFLNCNTMWTCRKIAIFQGTVLPLKHLYLPTSPWHYNPKY